MNGANGVGYLESFHIVLFFVVYFFFPTIVATLGESKQQKDVFAGPGPGLTRPVDLLKLFIFTPFYSREVPCQVFFVGRLISHTILGKNGIFTDP